MKKKNNGLVATILTIIIIGRLLLIPINFGRHVTPFEEPGQVIVSIAIVWVAVEMIKGAVKAHRGY